MLPADARVWPVSFDVVAPKEAVESLETALGSKPKMVAGVAVFTPKGRKNVKLMLGKVADWFSKKGERSIDIHLGK